MKANEFVNRFGWEKAKEFSLITVKGLSQEYCFEINTGESIGLGYINLDDIKRLVESHELIEKHGGLKEAYLKIGFYSINPEELKQAIADVESCKEVS